MSKRWTPEEDQAWISFFRGEVADQPEGREIQAARRRFEIPSVENLHRSVLHTMSMAAAKFLPRVPYKGQGHHARFIEIVQILAVHPGAVVGRDFPKDVLSEAVIAARAALHAAPAPAEAA